MKSRQFCSVCKDWLDMAVVPTSDGDEDDGVIWFRCPQCQGFLPKLSGGAPDESGPAADSEDTEPATEAAPAAAPVAAPEGKSEPDMPWDSPADMMAEQKGEAGSDTATAGPFLPEDESAEPRSGGAADTIDAPAEEAVGGEAETPSEPIHEYAAMLADSDTSSATPYRPWAEYAVGDCVHHLAWDDCGVVVGKEELPGGRKTIKCYFESAGVIRLIEQAPR